jgi:2-amino-4-hydroxy-6-hydroxymethyldihydropteridine diphosphokinase
VATAYLSLSSNAADPLARLDEAERLIGGLDGVSLLARSREHRGAAGRPRQRDYLYRVIGIETAAKARALLDLVIAIEAEMGRDHADVWGPRLIDIDILAYDDIEIRSSRLCLPHAFAHSRPYVLEPLREIAPDVAAWVVRVGTKPR